MNLRFCFDFETSALLTVIMYTQIGIWTYLDVQEHDTGIVIQYTYYILWFSMR